MQWEILAALAPLEKDEAQADAASPRRRAKSCSMLWSTRRRNCAQVFSINPLCASSPRRRENGYTYVILATAFTHSKTCNSCVASPTTNWRLPL